MRYKCPSCYMRWEDHQEPEDFLSCALCNFCSNTHTGKELLEHQIAHLENIALVDFPQILRSIYRYCKNE